MGDVSERSRAFLDTEEVPAVFSVMGGSPEYQSTFWAKYEAILGEGEVRREDKEFIGLGVAIAKPSPYMIAFQKERLKARGASDVAIESGIQVAEFFEGFDAFAHGLRVDSDLRPRPLAAGDTSGIDREDTVNVPFVKESDDPVVNGVYEEIKKTFGIPFVPNIFKALAHVPRALKAKWDCYKAVMLGEPPSRLTKELIAVAVSSVNACYY